MTVDGIGQGLTYEDAKIQQQELLKPVPEGRHKGQFTNIEHIVPDTPQKSEAYKMDLTTVGNVNPDLNGKVLQLYVAIEGSFLGTVLNLTAGMREQLDIDIWPGSKADPSPLLMKVVDFEISYAPNPKGDFPYKNFKFSGLQTETGKTVGLAGSASGLAAAKIVS